MFAFCFTPLAIRNFRRAHKVLTTVRRYTVLVGKKDQAR